MQHPVEPVLNNQSCSDQCDLCCSAAVEIRTNEPLFDMSRFRSYRAGLRIVSYVLRFISNLKARVSKTEISVSRNLSLDELKYAEIILIKQCQLIHCSSVLYHLQGKEGRTPSVVRQLRLVLRDGVIRSEGRMLEAGMTDSSKAPIFLPAGAPLTRLIISDAHELTLHSGVNGVLSKLRQRWWIPKARIEVKKVLRKCVTCNRVQSRPFKLPKTPPFPTERVTRARPFQFTGIDFTGAISVKKNSTISKCYIALFTCFVTRAVHLEVVQDNSEEEFLRALTRFSCRRSLPTTIYSDNATTFVGASRTLSDLVNLDEVQSFSARINLSWKFITPRSAWQGGVWERMIGVMKLSLKKIIGKACLSFVELQTIIVQIEARLNDRPLTYISDDVKDLNPLTPSLLIHGFNLTEFPGPVDFDEDKDYCNRKSLSDRVVYRNRLLDNFWKRWSHEYLTALRERYNFSSETSVRCPCVGEVVLLKEDIPRVSWKLAVVEELFPGRDGSIRTAKVRTAKGSLLRSVNFLCPLEVKNFNEINCVTSDNNVKLRRSERLSAVAAKQRIAKCCDLLS